MRLCFLVDLKLGRRLLWAVWLGEAGMRVEDFIVDDKLPTASQV